MSKQKKFRILAVVGLIVAVLILVFLIKFLKGWKSGAMDENPIDTIEEVNSTGESEEPPDSEEVSEEEGEVVAEASPVKENKIFRLRCYKRDIGKDLELPAGFLPGEVFKEVLPNIDGTYYIEETLINPETEKESKRFLQADQKGNIIKVYNSLKQAPVLDENGFMVISEIDIDGLLKSFITDKDLNRYTEIFENIEKKGAFYYCYKTVYDDYGPLFIETHILNKDLKEVYVHNDNIERPITTEVISDGKSILVNENGKLVLLLQNGDTYKFPLDATGVQVIEEAVVYNPENDRSKLVMVSALTGESRTFDTDLARYDILSYNFYYAKGDKEEHYYVNSVPIDTRNQIKKVVDVLEFYPSIVFIGEIQPEADVRETSSYYGLFEIRDNVVTKLSGNFTEIKSKGELYKPRPDVFYARDRRDNTTGGFYNMLNYKGEVVADNSYRIVEVREKDLMIRDGADPEGSEYFINSLNMKSVSKPSLLKRVEKDVSGYEKRLWTVPEVDSEKMKGL